jgi:hypothetical protein
MPEVKNQCHGQHHFLGHSQDWRRRSWAVDKGSADTDSAAIMNIGWMPGSPSNSELIC